MDSENMKYDNKIPLETIRYTHEEIENLKPANVLPTSQKILHEKALEYDLEKKFMGRLHSIPTIALKRICRNAGHKNVADDALFLENTIDVTKPFNDRATMSWMIKQILVDLIRSIYTNHPEDLKNSLKFITPRYNGGEEVHISPFFKKLGLDITLTEAEVDRIKSIPAVPIYDSNILVNAIKKNINITKDNKKTWEEYVSYVQYLDREWFTSEQLIDMIGKLSTVESPQEIKQIVCRKLQDKYPNGCYVKNLNKVSQMTKDKSLCEDALLTYLLHITKTMPDSVELLFEQHLERLAVKRKLGELCSNLKKGKDVSSQLLEQSAEILSWMDDTIDTDKLKEKLYNLSNSTEDAVLFDDTDKTVTKILKRSANKETIKEYGDTISYSDIYPGDLIMLYLSETINKHNKVHLETEFYMNFNTTDYYYIPKDTIKKAIEEIRSQLIQSDPKFMGCGGLRPDMRRIIHYMIEQWISQVAFKTKKFLEIWKSHSNNKTVSSTLSYKTMDSYKIFSS